MNALLPLLFLPLLCSFSFSPMSQSIELGEKQKGAQFMITNDGEEKLAIELTVRERQMNPDGKETLPETKEITIFPPQMIIPPKEKRTVRVNWNGPGELKAEKAFRVIAEQLPLKVDEKTKKQSGIQMLMRYMAALYVVPKNAGAELSVASFEQKKDGLHLTIQNSGNRHQVLLNPTLVIQDEGKKTSLAANELEGLAGENVLANSSRVFHLKKVKGVSSKARFKLKVDD